ncbi:hypothetical protein GCM10028805_30840 [Spirosoma harenae]
MPSFYIRLLSCLLLGSYTYHGYSQQHPYELKITSENDNYCLRFHDGYYTNGLFLTVNYLPDRFNKSLLETDKLTKVTSFYRLGQMIFTPGSISPTVTRDLMDRPYTGYLFLEKGLTFFYRKGHVLKTTLAAGTIGKNSLAEQSQRLIHKTFDLIPPTGWNYQIHNEIGINAQGQYWHELIPNTWRKSWLDVHSTTQIAVGNTFTNASAGLLFQVGLFAKPDQSSLYDARISRGNLQAQKATEFYIFWQPSYQYQLYNATVQGGLFSNNTGAILSPIRHWGYRHDIGFVFSQPRLTLQIVYSFKQREAATMRQDEQYVGLTAAYRFGK